MCCLNRLNLHKVFVVVFNYSLKHLLQLIQTKLIYSYVYIYWFKLSEVNLFMFLSSFVCKATIKLILTWNVFSINNPGMSHYFYCCRHFQFHYSKVVVSRWFDGLHCLLKKNNDWLFSFFTRFTLFLLRVFGFIVHFSVFFVHYKTHMGSVKWFVFTSRLKKSLWRASLVIT